LLILQWRKFVITELAMLQTNDYWIVCNRNGVVASGTKICGFRRHCWPRYPLYYNCLGPVKTGHQCDMLDLWLILNDEHCRYTTLSNVQHFASLVLFVVRASTGNLISGKWLMRTRCLQILIIGFYRYVLPFFDFYILYFLYSLFAISLFVVFH